MSSEPLDIRVLKKYYSAPKPLFVFTELHAENSKNEDDVDTGLLGMNCSFCSSDHIFKLYMLWDKIVYIYHVEVIH